MRQSLWALKAYQCVERAKADLTGTSLEEYRTMARALPVLLRRSGAAQTISYLEAAQPISNFKSEQDDKGSRMRRDLLSICGTALAEGAVAAQTSTEYIRISRDLILIADWFKRIVDAVLSPQTQVASVKASAKAAVEASKGGSLIRRRTILESLDVTPSTNAGLWFDRYLKAIQVKGEWNDRAPAKAHHIAAVADVLAVPPGYQEAVAKRRLLFRTLGAIEYRVTLSGRLSVWLKSGNALETGLALDHTWGMPIVPGASIKGAAAAACGELEGPEWYPPVRRSDSSSGQGRDFDLLFGSPSRQGCVRFLDCWWQPNGGRPISSDVLTPHFNDYYMNEGSFPEPSGMESPVPVPFPTTSGVFVGWLLGNVAWTKVALDLIRHAFRNRGLGARSGAGYGYGEAAADTA